MRQVRRGVPVRRGRAGCGARDDRGRGAGGDLGDGMAALRRLRHRWTRLWHLPQRHHQRDDGAAGLGHRADGRQDPAAFRRRRDQEHRIRPVCRFARRQLLEALFRRLLHGQSEADALRARAVPGCPDLRLLHRHPRAGAVGGFLRHRAGGREGVADQGQGGQDHRGGGQRKPGRRGRRYPDRRTGQPECGSRRAGHGHRAERTVRRPRTRRRAG